jgi:hypothetical protein
VSDLAVSTPEYFEILVLRELRKVGFELGQPRVHRRSELPEPERGFVLELTVPLTSGPRARRALVICRQQLGPVAADVIESARSRMADATADAVVVFAVTDFTVDALAAAEAGGVALLRIADGRSVFDASGWGSAGGAGGGGGARHETVRLRSRAFRVDATDDLLAALRDLLGADGVSLVKA